MKHLLYILGHFFWTPKGIIFQEVYLIAVAWIFARAYLLYSSNGQALGVCLIMFIAIEIALTVRDGRTAERMGHRMTSFGWRLFARCIRAVLGLVTAWLWLIWGAINGRIVHPETENAEETSWLDGLTGGEPEHPTRHYRFGRWLYRICYSLLIRIPVLSERETLVSVIARLIALVWILWDVWSVPKFIMT